MARTIRLLTITLKPLYLAPPNLVPFCLIYQTHFGRILAKLIQQGVAAVVIELRRLEKSNLRNFLFCFKTMEMQRYKLVPGKMFSGIKNDCSRVLLDSRGKTSNRDDLFHSGKEIFVTSYL